MLSFVTQTIVCLEPYIQVPKFCECQFASLQMFAPSAYRWAGRSGFGGRAERWAPPRRRLAPPRWSKVLGLAASPDIYSFGETIRLKPHASSLLLRANALCDTLSSAKDKEKPSIPRAGETIFCPRAPHETIGQHHRSTHVVTVQSPVVDLAAFLQLLDATKRQDESGAGLVRCLVLSSLTSIHTQVGWGEANLPV